MEQIILHIDVNNAFLSWTAISLLKNGYKQDIRNVYAVIGGDETKRHGIVLAKSNLAKKVGIVTAETLYSARKKCSNLKIFSPQYEVYEKMSQSLFLLLSKYFPDIEVFSIDECFVDYGKVKNMYGDELAFAFKLKEEIKHILGFTVNIGIGNNKLCAKMASDFLKPDLVHTLYDYEVKTKMWPLSIDNLFGIGRKTVPKLINLNIKTIGDLANADYHKLYGTFKNQTNRVIALANGIDDTPVLSNITEPKGISTSVTLNHDLTTKEEVFKVLNELSEKIGVSIRKQNKYGYVIAVNLKDQFFNCYSHQTKLKNPTNSTKEIFETAQKLFIQMWKLEPIRLVGIRIDQLSKEATFQMSLFENIEDRNKDLKLEKTIDTLRDKYGNDVVKRAYLIDKKK